MIATLNIEGKKYDLPLSYKDIKLSRFKKIQNFIDSDKIVTPFLLGDTKEEPTEQQIILYQVKFIMMVTDIPVNTLMKVNRHTMEDSIGLEAIFNSLSWLFIQPKETGKPVDKIGKYHFFDASGIMKDNTLVEYTEVNSINTALNNLDKDYNHINNLMAIFYRPKVGFFKTKLEPYNVESVLDRAKYFDDIDMETIYNALFFFLQSKADYLKNIGESLGEEVEREIRHSKGITGRFLNMILPKLVYLQVLKKRLMSRLI